MTIFRTGFAQPLRIDRRRTRAAHPYTRWPDQEVLCQTLLAAMVGHNTFTWHDAAQALEQTEKCVKQALETLVQRGCLTCQKRRGMATVYGWA